MQFSKSTTDIESMVAPVCRETHDGSRIGKFFERVGRSGAGNDAIINILIGVVRRSGHCASENRTHPDQNYSLQTFQRMH